MASGIFKLFSPRPLDVDVRRPNQVLQWPRSLTLEPHESLALSPVSDVAEPSLGMA